MMHGVIPELQAWQTAALKKASALRVDPQLVNEAVAVMRNVFGEEWLRGVCQRPGLVPWLMQGHPIGHLLTPPGEDQVLRLLELVTYLKAAAPSPAFPELVAGLKAQYGPTFLQLAFGFRLQRCGATHVHFEPPVSAGLKGDIGFRYGDKSYVAECYIPRNKPLSAEAYWLLQKCMEVRGGTDRRPSVLAIAIKLRATPSSVQRKQIVRLVRENCEAIDSNVQRGVGPDALYVEFEAAHISVARTVAVGPGAYSLGRQHHQFPDTKGEQPFLFARVGIGVQGPPGAELPAERETRDSVAVWLSDEDKIAQSLERDLDEPLRELVRKLERKLAQTKRDAATGRVLIVSSWISAQLHRASPTALQSLKRTLFVKHNGVAAVLLVLRSNLQTLQGARRPYYQIEAILPEGADKMASAVDAIRSIETREFAPRIL